MKEEALKFGIDQFNAYKRKLKKCMDENRWEGYLVQELTVPTFAVSSLEDKAA
jgi:hypothetical protein